MQSNRSETYGEHHEAFIDALVDSGRYRDRHDVIVSALRLLEEREAHFGAWCAEVANGAQELEQLWGRTPQ